ncbi:MAG: hypothetical protein ABW352_04640 [Polyangiales bacterium]
MLKLVRDLMSPTLFTTVPTPTPDYRALPDSASGALQTQGGTRTFLSTNADGTSSTTPVTAGTDLKLTHTPVATGQTALRDVDVAVSVEAATGVTVSQAALSWRIKGERPEYQRVAMTLATPAASSTPAANRPDDAPTPASGSSTPASSSTATAPATGGGAPSPGQPAGGTASPQPSTGQAGAKTFSAKIPGQRADVTLEYYVTVEGRRGETALQQMLPSNGTTAPLSYRVGTAGTQGTTQGLTVPQTDGPLIGYSLRAIDVTQQVKRKFSLTRSEAITQHYHPAGLLSSNEIGPAFDAAAQVTRVRLGEGPFKVLVIRANSTFDFTAHHVLSAVVHIEYGRNADNSGPLRRESITLTRAQNTGQVQFFADDAGTQTYDYWVEFSYDPDRLVGVQLGQTLRSPRFIGESVRSISLDMEKHSPVLSVEIQRGAITLANDGLIRQVQVRVSPSPTAEGRTVLLDSTRDRDVVLVAPTDPLRRVYHRQERFFFKDTSTTIEHPAATDVQVLVNEPSELVFKMTPQLVDGTTLVKEVLVDAVYRHSDGTEKMQTLRLTPAQSRSEFAVIVRPGDPRVWSAAMRFVLNAGEPIETAPQSISLGEPLVTLRKAGLKVVTLYLQEPNVFATVGDLLGIKVTLGRAVEDPSEPAISVMLRAALTQTTIVVPGLTSDAPLLVRTEILRRAQPTISSVTSLAGNETELFVTL